MIIFCHYIDDGFMLTSKANLPNIISNLYTSYPPQIPITFMPNHHTTHYLDLSLSLNHFTISYHIVHYQIYQKPHHKYMYPHFSSNHPHHIFSGTIKTEAIRVHTKNCNHFSRTTLDFQGQPTRNIISQIVQICIFPVYSNKTLRL